MVLKPQSVVSEASMIVIKTHRQADSETHPTKEQSSDRIEQLPSKVCVLRWSC